MHLLQTLVDMGTANSFILCYTSFTNYTMMAQYFPEYNRLRECWVGRAYDSSLVTDTFVKDILDETEEDLSNFSQMF